MYVQALLKNARAVSLRFSNLRLPLGAFLLAEEPGEDTDMKAQPNPILVDREALIQAMVALERQTEIQTILFSTYVDWLKTLSQRLEAVLMDSEALAAKHALHALLLPGGELDRIFTDEQLAAWQTEAQARLSCCERGLHPPALDTPDLAGNLTVPADKAVPRQSG